MSNQNIQDAFLNNARKERLPITIYLTSGVKLSGRVKGFDKYCVVFETSHQEQLIFKHAISTIVTPRHSHAPQRSKEHAETTHGHGPGTVPGEPPPSPEQPAQADERAGF